MSSATRASKPAAFIAAARRPARADFVRSGSPMMKVPPALWLTTPGSVTSADACTTQPRMCPGSSAASSSPPGSRQSIGRPSRRPPSLKKYHQGRPLIAGTTIVSGPTSVLSRGTIAAIEWVLRQTKTASCVPKSAGSSDAGMGKTERFPFERSVSPSLRSASRWAPRATRHTSCPARANHAPMSPPTAPAPTTQILIFGQRPSSLPAGFRREDELPHRPEVDAEKEVVAEFHAGVPAAAQAAHDRRVARERVRPVFSPARAVLREAAPLPVLERSERRAGLAQMALDLVEIAEPGPGAGGAELEPHQRMPGKQRPDVVQHQAAYRGIGLRREHHPDQASHRGSDPVDSRPLACSLEPAQEGDLVRGRGEPREQRG